MEIILVKNKITNDWNDLEFKRNYHRNYYKNNKTKRDKQHLISMKINKLELELNKKDFHKYIQSKIKTWKTILGDDFLLVEVL
jgi:hypothetical protein